MSVNKRERKPNTDAEWSRDVQRRLDDAENPESARLGDWTMSTQDGTGSLIACHSDGGCVLIARKPSGGDGPDEVLDPDSVAEGDDETPEEFCERVNDCVELPEPMNIAQVRGSGQTMGNTPPSAQQLVLGVNVMDYRPDGQDTQVQNNGIRIRDAGVYEVEATAAWQQNLNGRRELFLRRNGATFAFDVRDAPGGWCMHHIHRTIELAVGDLLTLHVWQNSGGNLAVNNSAFGGDTWPRITARMIRRHSDHA
ncbi:hypothetical protein [Hoyosella altamirensis]|uniref:hypothetical protein n=1 Tax=Hoyosella altamirensis TaxID=616997 RepID=UPI0007DAF879|nr:hypothetical protein [Hoyosella altamirensis]